MSHEAHHDALTGLPNRVWFGEQLAARMPTTGSVLLIDLDCFKDVNDTLGHPTGDRVLTIIARRLEGLVGPRDLLARLGGDEFALFTPGAPDQHGHPAIIKSVVAAIETPVSIDEFSVHVGASIGVALVPDHGDDETTLLSRADIAMYCAKQSGSTQHVYHPDDDTHSPARLKLQVDLRHAVEHRGLEPWYQPKVDTATGAIVGLEALCRWRHADGSFVSPAEFVPIAEASGLMRKLTTSVLERVVADLRSWAALGLHVPVAVNLSARDLLDESLPDQIATMLELNGVAPELLGFEVTETAFMVDRYRVVDTLRRLRDAGATLAIDDYGTGYSSMSYLKDLPVDVLKIDRAFVDGVDRDPLNHALVKSTIELGHNLGLTVVAEGVERAEEHEQLIALGCDQCQGYYFDRPMPSEELIERVLVPRETPTLLG